MAKERDAAVGEDEDDRSRNGMEWPRNEMQLSVVGWPAGLDRAAADPAAAVCMDPPDFPSGVGINLHWLP